MNNPCGHCDHDKAIHANGLGMCRGTCRCSRYIKQTVQTRQIKAMRQAIAVVVDMLEDWRTYDEAHRSIRVGSPTLQEKKNMIAQLKKAVGTI